MFAGREVPRRRFDGRPNNGARMIVEWVTAIGEFLIAGVIYRELDEARASSCMSILADPQLSDARKELYDAYVSLSPEAMSLRDRAVAFSEELFRNPELRSKCDQQWNSITRCQYALRYSIFHRSLAARWYPQVIVSLWIMTGPYMRQRQQFRPAQINKYTLAAVRKSAQKILHHSAKTDASSSVTITGPGSKIVIGPEVIGTLKSDLDAPFRA